MDARLELRVDTATKDHWKRLASEQNLSISEFLRATVNAAHPRSVHKGNAMFDAAIAERALRIMQDHHWFAQWEKSDPSEYDAWEGWTVCRPTDADCSFEMIHHPDENPVLADDPFTALCKAEDFVLASESSTPAAR